MKTSSTQKILRQELEERLLSLDEEIAGRQKILSKLEAATSKFEAVLKKTDDAAKGYEAQTVQLRETADLEKKLSALQSQVEALEKDLVLARSKAEEQGQIESEIARLRTEISRQKQDQGSEKDKQAAEIVELETELLSKRTSAEQLKQTVDILSNEQKALLQNIEDLEDKQMSQKKEILEFKDGSSELLKEKDVELGAASGKLEAMSQKYDELANKLSLMTEEAQVKTVNAEKVLKTADDGFAKGDDEFQGTSEEPVLDPNNFAERKIPSTLEKLAKELLEARERLAEYKKPKVTLSFLSTYIWDLKQKIISTLKKQKKTRHETAKYIFAIRDIPKYFRITDEKALLKTLKRRGLQRFIKKVEIVELDDLKDYLVERKIRDLSGLKSIENKQTVYVYPKQAIKKSEENIAELLDIFIENIETFDPSRSTNEQLADDMRICCKPETPVFLNPGVNFVENADIGERGLNFRITDTHSRFVDEELTRFKVAYLGWFSLTKEHPVKILPLQTGSRNKNKGQLCRAYTSTRGGKSGCGRGGHWTCIEEQPRWKEAKNLLRYDAVAVPKLPSKTTSWSIEHYALAGWYLAEGFPTSDNGIRFSLGKTERKHTDNILHWAWSLGAKKVWASELSREIRIQIIDADLFQFLTSNFGMGSHHKTIPLWCLEGEPNKVKHLLDCYFKGDGWKTKTGRKGRTVSKKLAYGIWYLFTKFGRIASISEGTYDTNFKKNCKSFCISINDSFRKSYSEDNEFFWLPIRKITSEKYSGPVHNLATTSETYGIPFIVHNCHAWWATLHDPEKEIKYSKEEIVEVAKKIYNEIKKRVAVNKMVYSFHPEKMTRLSCKLYCKVSGGDPKVCVEENAEIFQEPKHSMAVIGSRTATPEMLEATAYQTKKALAGGWGVVTGGAAGVDAEAIRTALKVLPKPTGGKMAFRVLPVANFLDSKGHVFTSRPYNLPDATVMVEGLGPCRRVKIGKATPELYTRHLSESGFKSITDWQGAKFSPGKEHYIYRVEQLPKNKMLRVYLPKTIKDQPVAVQRLLLEAKTRGFDIVENAGVDRAKTLFKGKPTYGAACYARNKTIIDKSAAVVAVQRGTSKGTSHGIADALERGKAVKRIDENLNTTLMKKEKGKVTVKSLGKLGKGIRALGKLSKVLKVLPAVGFLTDAFDAAILWQELKTLDEAIKTGKATETQKEIWKMLQEQRQAALTEQEWKDIQTILGQPSMPPALKELKVASEDTQNLDKLEVEEIPGSQIADVCTSHEDSESVLDTEIMQESPLKLQRLPGIYLVEPHGRFIAIGDKVSIIKSRPFPNMTGKDLYLISDNLCWGIINLKTAEKITQDQFRRRKDSHKISMEEAEEWWDLAGQPKKELYDFRFKVKRIFAPPKPVKIPRGIQTFLKPESISFEKV